MVRTRRMFRKGQAPGALAFRPPTDRSWTCLTSAMVSELLVAHQQLVEQYVAILQITSSLGTLRIRRRLFAGPVPGGHLGDNLRWVRFTSLGFLVRLFAESHIEAKLKELASAYRQEREAMPSDAAEDREILARTAESCDLISTGFSTWKRIEGVAGVLVPVVIGITVASIGAEDIYQAIFGVETSFVIALMIILLPLAAFGSMTLINTFEYKRELFLPGAFALDHPKQAVGRLQIERNVYDLEDRLFACIERRKSREALWDVLAAFIGDFILGVAAGFLIYSVFHGTPSIFVSLGASVGAFLVYLYIAFTLDMILIPRRRKFR